MVQMTCYSNSAACNLRLKNFEEALQCCQKVLEGDPNNVKVLYRKAQAQAGEKDYEGAMATLKEAHTIEPANQEIKSYYTKVQQLDKAHKQKQAAVFSNMFG